MLIGDITNSFSNQIVKGIEDIAHQNGYQVMIGNSNYNQESEDKYIESMLLLGVDGFIIQPTSNFRKYSRIIDEKRRKWSFLIVSCTSTGLIGLRLTIMMQYMM